MAHANPDETWAELSRLSRRATLYRPDEVPSLLDDIDGWVLTFRGLADRLCGLLLFLVIVPLLFIRWDNSYWQWGQTHFYLVIVLCCIGLLPLYILEKRLFVTEIRCQGDEFTILKRSPWRVREVVIPAGDITVTFEVATGDRWRKEWLGKGMVILNRRGVPDQPIVAVVAQDKSFRSLCEELSRRPRLEIEDRISEPLVLPDGKEIRVCRMGLGSTSASFRNARLRFRDDEVTAIVPTWRGRFFWGVFLVIGAVSLGFSAGGSQPLSDRPGHLFGVVIGVLFALVGGAGLAWSLLSGVVFDRRSQTVTMRRHLFSRARSRGSFALGDVAGVQMSAHYTGGEAPNYPVMEMNLVLAEPAGERIALVCHADFSAVRSDAKRLAGFLGKPLIDHSGYPANQP